jgi:hypothetical protein
VSSQTVVRSAVQHPQQLYLNMGRQFADFIQEQRSLICQFEESGLGVVRAAEGAFFVAEQFALDQVLGESRAVDINPGFAVAVGKFVDAASDQLFTTAGFPSDQDRFSVASHAFDHGHEALHRATGKDELSAVDLALNRRCCFQCIPHRLAAYTSSASTLLPRLIPSRAKEKASTARNELIRNPSFGR